MKRWEGNFNWYGETFNMWAHAESKRLAFLYMVRRFSKKKGRTFISILNYFEGKENSYEVRAH